jgi:acyl carrier protein phosphodiesterase
VNYLAHLYFSAPSALAWAGSLMGDFVKGPIPSHYPQELAQHLWLHRRIDTYTLASPAFQRSRRTIDPKFRYARGILVDVFYDHFLARSWDSYAEQPLAEFAQQVYQGLQTSYDLLPATLQQQLPRMIEHDWLTSYQHADVVLRVLQRLEARLKHRFPLADGIDELESHYSELENDFAAFMDEVASELTNWPWPTILQTERGGDFE